MASSLTQLKFSELLQPFFSLSYPVPKPAQTESFTDSSYYATGPKDLLFVVGVIAVMAVLRDITRIYVFEPFAKWKLMADLRTTRTNGHTNGHANGNGRSKPSKKELQKVNHGVVRFAEQGWALIYYTAQWCFGVYVNVKLQHGLISHSNLWIGYPHTPLAGPVKFYYLTQTAFYTHQILVLQAEAHRKDHIQMMSHHFITVFLMGLSYAFHCTRVGSIIMVLMDTCDIYLPLGKMTKYIGLPHQISDWVFAVFMLSWFVTRHIFYNLVLWSTIFDLPKFIDLEWKPEIGKFLTVEYHHSHLPTDHPTLMVRYHHQVAIRVVVHGEEADDVRSDDEDDGESDDKKKD
ncbi:TLC domain-containing protein [Flagelloscypha sp. PMI_526]|nr:TLC domain-containing protein [Flagelloscypha sp. PMI_526]